MTDEEPDFDDSWDPTGYYRRQQKRRINQSMRSIAWTALFAAGLALGMLICEAYL